MNNRYCKCLIVLMLSSIAARSQDKVTSLMVSGGSNGVPVVQMNGKNYVSVEALAQAANASLSFRGSEVILTLPNAEASNTAAPSTTAPQTNAGFSNAFLRAGIEAMSTLREWHSALASAIENNYPVTNQGLAPYQGRAATSLGLAQAAATTNADQNLAQLIADAYQKMKQLSDKYVADRQNMNYVSPDALANDPSNQSLVACGKSLAAMVASRQFSNDGSCH